MISKFLMPKLALSPSHIVMGGIYPYKTPVLSD